MQPSPFIDLDAVRQRELLAIARRSIADGLNNMKPLRLQLDQFDKAWQTPMAVFVTLTQDNQLRGCIGSLQARDALPQAVADAAFSSAFHDPRFSALTTPEFDATQIEISVLSPLEAVATGSRAELMRILRPGIDGLVIEDSGRRATFLPKVWDKMATAEAFLSQLLLKAGLPADYWSETIQVQRYSTLVIADN